MSPEEKEAHRERLCGMTDHELLMASAECTAKRCEYVRSRCRRGLTEKEKMEMAFVDDLQDLINEAKDALACMREEVPFAIAPRVR